MKSYCQVGRDGPPSTLDDPRENDGVVIFGGKYSIDLASNSRSRQADDLIKIQRQDFLLEYGVGFQVFFPYFILSPEIKFSHGLLNIHDRNAGLIYSRVIDRLLARGLTISFHFEG